MAFANSDIHRSLPEQHRPSLVHEQTAYYDNSPPSDTGPGVDAGSAVYSNMGSDQHGQFRKDSLTSSAGVLTPASDLNWNQKQDARSLGLDHDAPFAPTNPFYTSGNNYHRQDSNSHASSTLPVLTSWPFEATPGASTPTHFDVFSPPKDYDVPQYAHHAAEHPPPSYSSFTPIQEEPGYVSASHIQTPSSPRSTTNTSTDYMALHAQEASTRSMPRRMQSSGSARRASDCLRPDGIRKKNTRIEIPPERSLSNIETLLEQSKDDDEIKELKSHRRLLRNREAALASRQRKKKHTEDLEGKEKVLVTQLNNVESDLQDVQIRLSDSEAQRHFLAQQLSEARHLNNVWHFEKEELVHKHTQETGLLRRRVQYLSEQLEAIPDSATPIMSAAPSSAGFNDFTSDMDALTVNSHGWGDFGYGSGTHDMPFDPNQMPTSHLTADLRSARSGAAQAKGTPQIQENATAQPIASGVLFMILLCGAFAVSRSASRSVIPRMPEEVRTASTTVLDSLLKDPKADMFALSTGGGGSGTRSAIEPGLSHVAGVWPLHPSSDDSRLQTLQRQLTTPSRAQEAEQLFALTADEYHSMTTHEPAPPHHQRANPANPPRRNLAEALASFRDESVSKGGAADVYTRSLLWDQIPADVVKQFKELVRESKKADETASRHRSEGNVAGQDYDRGHPSLSTFAFKAEP